MEWLIVLLLGLVLDISRPKRTNPYRVLEKVTHERVVIDLSFAVSIL
jgi:hypothetical protein